MGKFSKIGKNQILIKVDFLSIFEMSRLTMGKMSIFGKNQILVRVDFLSIFEKTPSLSMANFRNLAKTENFAQSGIFVGKKSSFD